MSYICILGRQPAIGLAELESLYGRHVSPIGTVGAHVSVPIDFERLGSSVKCAELIASVSTTNPQKAFDFCRHKLMADIAKLPEGKIKLGVSLYDLSMPVHKINANVLSLKKVLRTHNRSVRAIPNVDMELSSAQTLHNQLTSELGFEILMIRDGTTIHIGRVTDVQDITAYTLRDRGRPKRDAFVGMLPPKLAQTIINLAASTSPAPLRLLDPFCGTGVILQEAALMHYDVYGSDVSEKMIRFSRDNLNWLMETHKMSFDCYYEIADATNHIWQQPIDIVAGEGYLGQPLGGQSPAPQKLAEIIHGCNVIMRDFFKNIAPQLNSGTRICVAVPAWFIDDVIHRLPMLDDLNNMGYNYVDFEYVSHDDLIYHRDGQVVGRELLVLIKQ